MSIILSDLNEDSFSHFFISPDEISQKPLKKIKYTYSFIWSQSILFDTASCMPWSEKFRYNSKLLFWFWFIFYEFVDWPRTTHWMEHVFIRSLNEMAPHLVTSEPFRSMLRNGTYLLLENNLFVIALICLTRPSDFLSRREKIFLKYTKSIDRAVSESSLMRTSVSCWLELKKSLILQAITKRCMHLLQTINSLLDENAHICSLYYKIYACRPEVYLEGLNIDPDIPVYRVPITFTPLF